MRFVCCGVVYSTNDPETYWCIEKYVLKTPQQVVVNGHKIVREVVYSLFCKKNDCSRIEIQRFSKMNGEFVLEERQPLKGEKARKYLKRTKNMRIKLPQRCPIKAVAYSPNIPWVYGKSIDGYRQVARYIDESGNRDVFKNNGWQKEIFQPETVVYKI